MQAFVLGAGLGTRLRPLTDLMPKVMVPIAPSLPLLEFLIVQLKLQGVDRILVNLHYKGEQIVRHFGDGARWGLEIAYSDESDRLLDVAGALKRAEPLLDDEFLLVYGDQLHTYDFGPLLELHQRARALATVALKRTGHPQDGDCAEVEPTTGRIVGWHARPHSIMEFADRFFLNTGLDVIAKPLLDHVPAGRPVSLDREILPRLVAAGAPVYGLPTETDILDIGTPEKYAAAQEWFARWAAESRRRRKALFLDRDGVLIHALPRGSYLTRRSEMQLLDGARQLIHAAATRGYLRLVATNQPQVNRGLLALEQLVALHDALAADFGRQLDAFYVCPHIDEDRCDCRKPKPGLLLRAGRDFGVDAARSWMIGDSDKDVRAAQSAGVRAAFLRNPYNAAELERCHPDAVLASPLEAIPLLE